jgi:hypothetical protein
MQRISIEFGLDVPPLVAADVRAKLESWRYVPYVSNGKAIAVCFPASLPRTPDPTPGKPGAGSGSGKPPGGGTGSGSGKPPPGPGSGSGSGKPPPGPGSGSGSGSGKPPPGPGSGSGKPPPGPGSGSGPPPPPPIAEQVGPADLAAAMKSIDAPLRNCRRRFPAVHGTMKLSLRVAPDGRVQEAVVTQTPDRAPINCVERAARGAKFPVTRRGGSLDHQLEF